MRRLGIVVVLGLAVLSCSTVKEIKRLEQSGITAKVVVADIDNGLNDNIEYKDINKLNEGEEEELSEEIKKLRGDRILMNAIMDEMGEMVAVDELAPVVVEAKFRNVAERNGKVDLAFDVIIPKEIINSNWRVSFTPHLFVKKDTLELEAINITGERYRAAQLKGYELYNKFINSIIPDSCLFTHSFCYMGLLNTFIARNFKELWQLKEDSTIVDQERAATLFGVTEREAIEYYTKSWLLKRNNRRKLLKDKMYRRYVKSPIRADKIRLDSVVTGENEIRYKYIQTIAVKEDLKKVELVLNGAVDCSGREIYKVPPTPPITFYISSMLSFVEQVERYNLKIIERVATANLSLNIDFKVGESHVIDTLNNNRGELKKLSGLLGSLFDLKIYDLDSVRICGSSSPEGLWESNRLLSIKRGEAVKEYLYNEINRYIDSVRKSTLYYSFGADMPDTLEESEDEAWFKRGNISLFSIPENWDKLSLLLQRDLNINWENIKGLFDIENLDLRERQLQRLQEYKYIKENLYPQLRSVDFTFYMHRRGMVKDTIHTTELDTLYMKGVELLRAREYKSALEYLREYKDINTTIAYISLDYNNSALAILEHLPEGAKRDYLLAVVYYRLGREREAVEKFLQSCSADNAMIFRGNLDPEISELIKKYRIVNGGLPLEY